MDKKDILKQFQVEGDVTSIEPYGSGHINHTYLAQMEDGKKYILQGINTTIFKDTDQLMENILNVTSYLREEIVRTGGDPARETLTVVMTNDGKSYYTDEEGNKWRVYDFIEGAQTFDAVESKEDFYQSAVAFGNFQAKLANFPADTLHETIPNFHNTAKRYRDLEKAIEEDVKGRVAEVGPEIAFVRERSKELSELHDMLAKGDLPLRVTHNDTKLNNIMIDSDTHKAICVIDLDTVMPGLSAHDFGDAIRFGANTAAEDEPDVSKVSLSLELFEIYVKGFLEGCGGRLTPNEVKVLPMGAKMMTIECGMRFLADYLEGDVYFKISREKHNLERCRTQFALVADMEKKWQQMCELCQ
ncbi:MAG: aminoglycoside phosphotransferase family protein [Eubacterium sp.]|jgi:Ser/Thr protein kinase RdoA (MazF antagonist)|nr:aminoglycoside phosphotransferase family protein [Eubacterium sp.]